jgi:hypothetical protein
MGRGRAAGRCATAAGLRAAAPPRARAGLGRGPAASRRLAGTKAAVTVNLVTALVTALITDRLASMAILVMGHDGIWAMRLS